MSKLKLVKNEEKPSVVTATNGFNIETNERENEFDYQNENAFADTNIQDESSENNIDDFVVIECAGRIINDPVNAVSWAFVVLNEDLEIIHEDSEGFLTYMDEIEEYTECFAVIQALEWALSLPKGNEIFIVTDSKFVTEPHQHDCEEDQSIRNSRNEISQLMSMTDVHSIKLIPREINHAAILADNALGDILREFYERREVNKAA